VASFLGWCASQGVEWSSISLASLARFKHFVEATPHRDGRLRSGATVNATLTAVCEFLRFCARTGVIEQAVAGQLSEPRWLRFTPPGFDAGESGQFRMMRARMLKARAETPFPEAFTAGQAEQVMACCQRPRERFMVRLLLDGGLRIGEALGLRRSDLHLLPDSRCVGCAVLGAHVHVRHRANPNGALAKSRFPRTVPASDAVLSSYAGYQHERAGILGEDDCDMVFVNLYREPLGAPMTYRAAKRLFERLARECGFAVRPHMFRHTAATSSFRAEPILTWSGPCSAMHPSLRQPCTCMPVTRTSAGRSRPSPRGGDTGEPPRAAGGRSRRRPPGTARRGRVAGVAACPAGSGLACRGVGRRPPAVHRRSGIGPDRGMAVPHPRVPDGDAPPVGTL
jgi:integrase